MSDKNPLGRLHFDCITLGVIPEELEAMSESTGVASLISANSLILKSGRSGPFSWTKSAFDNASFRSAVKVKRSRDAPFKRPILVRSFQASSMYLRKLASAFGAGSVGDNIESPRQVFGGPTGTDHASANNGNAVYRFVV
jgi:hypothetical protein